MKILAISDRPPKSSILKTIAENNVDIVITLGDLTIFDINELKNVNIPKIGVYGNHCSGMYFEPLGIKNLHLQTFEFQGIKFGGFEGSLKYKNSDSKMYTQDEADELLKNFPHVDVMIAHSPPYGINDEPGSTVHEGFRALRNYLDEKKPKYFFHGHTYPNEESIVHRYRETEIIYVIYDQIITIF